MLPKNVGGLDRKVRAVGAVVLAAVGVAALLGALPLLGWVGGVALLVGSAGLTFNVLTQRCLGNHLLGIDTCPAPRGD
jgi:hypothetical protein